MKSQFYHSFITSCCLLIGSLCNADNVYARKGSFVDEWPKNEYDSSYIQDFHKDLVLRFYGSRKYTQYGLGQRFTDNKVNYKPNSPLNLGLGFNYRIIGINIGFNFPFINTTSQYGRTKFLDLQSHLYGREWIVDLFLQAYKGYYLNDLSPIYNTSSLSTATYIRPDLRILHFGLQTQYLLNGKRFSFRGAFLQNEKQLKSAGSAIVGASIGRINIQADSNIIPEALSSNNFFNDLSFNHNSINSISLNVGYGYTLVIARDWFATLAASLGYGVNFSVLSNKGISESSDWGSQFNGTFRSGLGYNSEKFFAGIHYIGTLSRNTTPIRYTYQQLGAGNFRFSIAKRIFLKKKLLGMY